MMRRVFFIVLVLTAILATACGTIATPEPSSIEQTEIALLDESHDDDVSHTNDVDADHDDDTDEAHEDDDDNADDDTNDVDDTNADEDSDTNDVDDTNADDDSDTNDVDDADTDEDSDTNDVDDTDADESVATEAPTATDIPPTATLEPATATPVPPTATSLPPTEAPTEEASTDTEDLSEITLLIQENGNASDGEAQFAAQACMGCHTVDEGGADIVGPNQWELYLRAGERVEGLSAEEYVYRSIIAPSEHIVEGFIDGMMPPTYEMTMTEQQLYDVVAYLLSLGNDTDDEEATNTSEEIEALADTEETDTDDEERLSEITLLIQENGDPTRGQQIFTAQACMGCHTVDEGGMAVIGPNQWELYLRAGDRVEGLSAEEYVYRSIIEPSEYIVEGFTDGMMPQTYDVMITPLELYDVVAYLLSLGAESE